MQVDPKKALVSQDGDAPESYLEGELLSLESNLADPQAPERFATILQFRSLGKELLLASPMIAFAGLRIFGLGWGDDTLRFVGFLTILWLWVAYPLLGLHLIWEPFRRKRKEDVGRAFAGLFGTFLAAVQGGMFAFLVVVPLFQTLGLISRFFVDPTSTRLALDLAVFVGMIVGCGSLVASTAAILAEKEIESLPEGETPSPQALALAKQDPWAMQSIQAFLRVFFRAGSLAGLAILPGLVATGHRIFLYSEPWIFLGQGLMLFFAANHLARGIFYLTLRRSVPRLLVRRHQRYQLESQPGEGEESGESEAGKDLVVHQEGLQIWIRGKMLQPKILAGFFLQSLAFVAASSVRHWITLPAAVVTGLGTLAWVMLLHPKKAEVRTRALVTSAVLGLVCFVPAWLLSRYRGSMDWLMVSFFQSWIPLSLVLVTERMTAWMNTPSGGSTEGFRLDRVRRGLFASAAYWVGFGGLYLLVEALFGRGDMARSFALLMAATPYAFVQTMVLEKIFEARWTRLDSGDLEPKALDSASEDSGVGLELPEAVEASD